MTDRLATPMLRASKAACAWIALCVLLLSSAGPLGAQSSSGQSAQNTLTNDQIVQLERAKVGEDVIVGMIQTMPTKFSLDPNSVIRLKQQGVSDKVLAAMVAKGSSASSAAVSAPVEEKNQPLSAAERRAATETLGTWEMRDTKDPMTDEESYEAHLVVKNDSREKIEVTATCSSSAGGGVGNVLMPAEQAFFDQMKSMGAPMGNSSRPATTPLPPIEEMNFEINYVPKAGQRLARVTAPVTGTVERAPEVFGTPIGDDTVTFRGGQSCVHVSMRLGNMYYQSVNAGGCGTRNTLDLSFSSSDPKLTDYVGSDKIKDNVLGSLLNSYAQGTLNADRGYDATLKDVQNADKFLVGLPLSDGTLEVVPIATTEPSFKKFTARCDADLAKLTPAPAAAPPKPRPSIFAPGVTPTPWAQAMLNPPKFAGSVDQFAAALPGFLQKAGQAAGFDGQAFSKESASVVDAVRTCATITPAMAARATRNGPLGQGMIVMRDLGPEYAICQSGTGFGPNAQYTDTSLIVRIDSESGKTFRAGKGFTAFVYFARPKQGAYPVISATISGPG